jgi:hypothetical protein
MIAADKGSCDFREIFVPHLLEIEGLMEEQLKMARGAGHRVQV